MKVTLRRTAMARRVRGHIALVSISRYGSITDELPVAGSSETLEEEVFRRRRAAEKGGEQLGYPAAVGRGSACDDCIVEGAVLR